MENYSVVRNSDIVSNDGSLKAVFSVLNDSMQFVKSFASKDTNKAKKRAENYCIGEDLKEYITKNINDIAESHLEAWKDRYSDYGGNANRMKDDLWINHDPSLEIEGAEDSEDGIGRKLNDYEIDYLVEKFNQRVYKIWKNK